MGVLTGDSLVGSPLDDGTIGQNISAPGEPLGAAPPDFRPLYIVLAGLVSGAVGGAIMGGTDMSCYHNPRCSYDNGMPGSFGFGIFLVAVGALAVLVGLIAFAVRVGTDIRPRSVEPLQPPKTSASGAPTTASDHSAVRKADSAKDPERQLKQLMQLTELMRTGMLTDVEFETMKHGILADK
jgi:hypothetical protein